MKSEINRRENPEPLELRVQRYLQEHRLMSGQRKLLVAVSGGPDSVCLLHILVALRRELGIELHVAHLNHQLRGAESEADARYVAELTRSLGLPASVEARDVKAYRRERRLSLEEAAREVRYTFLAQVARAAGTDRVAVGHTIDDHTETILMHLVRGTGIAGLRGLQPISRWRSAEGNLLVVRPLLTVSRQETTTYCQRHSLSPRTDSTNLSLSPLRNRIRRQLLPLLRSYNPRITEALLRTARIATEDIAFIDKETERLWTRVSQAQGNTIALDKARFLQLPLALQRHLLRRAIEELLGNLKDIERRHIEAIMAALTKPAGRRLSLPGGLIFSMEYDRYLLGPDREALVPFPALDAQYPLQIPGETILPGWRIEADIVERAESRGEDDFTADFDRDKTGDKLSVRPRQSGDRFQPLGMSQPKTLGEFMIDSKIPAAWRERIPIVCSLQQIIWVVGWRIDDRVKITENTRRVLRLKFERKPT